MKKRFLVLAALILSLIVTATGCGKDKNTAGDDVTPSPSAAAEPTAEPTAEPAATEAPAEPSGSVTVVSLGDYLDDASHWEDDGGDYSIKDGSLIFNNAYYGDFCAVRLKDEFQNMTAQFTLQFTDIATDVSEDEGTWWDAEFLCLLRSNFAGSSFVEGIDGQAGYCITSWGDMTQFALGRSGYDDAFGTFDWPLGDGQPHKIEFTVENNEDNTVVNLTVKVDGEVIATAADDGSLVKKDRVALFPDAGGITLRCKYLGAEVTK